MLIGSRQRLSTFQSTPTLAINGNPIKQVFQAKSLGMHIGDTLSWDMHIKEVVKKIACGIGTLKRVRNCVPTQTLNIIYNALVLPHFNYCAEVWNSCGSTL